MLKMLRIILPPLLILAYLILVSTFVSEKERGLDCQSLEVEVVDSADYAFVNSKDILALVGHKCNDLIGQSIDSIDKENLESVIDKNPLIKRAEVYNTLTGKLRVIVEQRIPIIRVLGERDGYYVDEEGDIMPLSSKFTSRVLVASGDISSHIAKGELFELARFINNDKFWNSMIEQIYVTSEKEFILVPRVGARKIFLGDMNDYRWKFDKLAALYRDGFSRTGWNKYIKIDLRYKDQIVCTKR